MKNLKNINFRYLSQTRRFLSLSVLIGLGSVLLVFLVIIPQVSSSLELWENLQKKQQIVTQLELKSAQLQQASGSQVLFQADRINQLLPSHKPLLETLSGLSAVASNTDVRYQDIALTPGNISTESAQPQQTIKQGNRVQQQTNTKRKEDTLDLRLTVVGTIGKINSFLREIERTAPITSVTGMKLIEQRRSLDSEDNEVQFQADLSISTHFFNQSVSATVTTPIPQLSGKQQQTLDSIGSFLYPVVQDRQFIQGGGREDLFGVEENSEENILGT